MTANMRKHLRTALALVFVLMCAFVLCLPALGCSSTDAADDANAKTAQSSNDSSTDSEQTDAGATGAQWLEEGAPASMTSFATTTLGGNTFTQDDLAAYDLTMVNIWTTTCTFCIEEMPALSKLASELPSNVNLIGICADASVNSDVALSIAQQSGISFPVLIDNDDLNASLLQYVSGVPTTVFVDSAGNLVGRVQIGAPSTGSDEEIIAEYQSLIDQALREVA